MYRQVVADARLERMINTWPENRINIFANTMNMLLWCIKGLGVLIITWTTVVLLGGFVSLLQKEDFWCLTAITIVQLAGAFNIFLSKTIKAFWASFSKSMMIYNDPDDDGIKNQLKELFNDIKGLSLAWKVIAFIFGGICMVFYLIILVAALIIGLIIASPIIVAMIVILSPIIAIYIFGMCISAAISVWRLWENDYGNAADDGANFKAALIVLYSMVVLQGVLFGLTGFYYCAIRKKVTRQVERAYDICHQSNLVSNYLRETVAGCQKDRAFLEGRNLVTYAVDQLMKPAVRPEMYISGLSSIISASSLETERQVRLKEVLVESSSYSQVIHKLLRILHPKSHYSTGTKEDAARIVAFLADEINLEEFPRGIQCISSLLDTFEEYPWLLKDHGQQLVLADDDRVVLLVDDKKNTTGPAGEDEKPPPRYRCRSRTNCPCPENPLNHGDRVIIRYKLVVDHEAATETLDNNQIQIKAYKKLVLQGLRILAGLADSEDNCRVIGNTVYLLSRITAPLVSIRLHQEHHDVWSSIAEESLILMCKLMAAPGETADSRLRCHISSDGGNTTTIVSTLQSILQCTECEGKAVQLVAMEILLDLSSVDTGSIIMASGSPSGPFIVILLRVFLQIYSTSSEKKLLHKMCTSMHWMKKRSYMRNLAGNMLASLSSHTTAILRVCVSSSVLGDLVNTFVNARDNTYRMRAAEILEHLCVGRYTEDDEDLKKLKKALLDAMPKVLRELLGYYGTTREGVQAATGNVTSCYSPQGSDLEEGRPLHDNSPRSKYSSCWENSEQHGNGALKEALLSLCVIVGCKFISTDPDQARRFDKIASKICSELGKKTIKTFSSLMEEAKEILNKNEAKQFATASDNFSSGG